MRCVELGLGFALATAGSLCAQSARTTVVPATFANREAPGTEFWCVSPFAARRQLVLDARHAGALLGQRLSGIAVRRNAGDGSAQAGGQLWIEVWLSHAAHGADEVGPSFAANRGPDHRRVFAGTVVVPDAPALATTPAPWSAPNAVTIPFTTPFACLGGSLCIETVTDLAPPNGAPFPRLPWWPIDAQVLRPLGTATPLGTSCVADLPGQPAGAEAASLILGATGLLWLRGPRAGAVGACVLGTNLRSFGSLSLPFDLGPFGAPGCTLYTDVVVSLPFVLAQPGVGAAGLANVELPLPALPMLVGRPFYTQWLLSDPLANALGVTLSNAVELRLGLPTPALGYALIESADLASPNGRVLSSRCPVVQFTSY